jgi:DNA-3-methyladenine glycosylase
MRARRGGKPDLDLCSGPGKLTEALGVDLSDNERDLSREPFFLSAPTSDPPAIVTSPRIGITKAVDRPWRFSAAGSRYVSRPIPQ